MVTRPDLSDDTLRGVLADYYGLRMSAATFVPSGDTNSAVFSVTDRSGARYFLKLRSDNFDDAAVAVAAFLHSRGIVAVMASIASVANQFSLRAHDFDWMLYPHFEGSNGFELPLSRGHWIALGAAMREVHQASPPAELARRVPREEYSPRYRAIVKALDDEVDQRRFDDPSAAGLAAVWKAHRADIRLMVEHAEHLADTIRNRSHPFVLCHTDLHAGNVLVGLNNSLAIIDWDNPILAPKERDLMFIGAGVGGIWIDAREAEWFFAGYGATHIDPDALAYYRCERVVTDFAEYGEFIMHGKGGAEDRAEGLRKFISAFAPNNPFDMARRSQ